MNSRLYLPIVSISLAALWGCDSPPKASAGQATTSSTSENSTTASSPASGGSPTASTSGTDTTSADTTPDSTAAGAALGNSNGAVAAAGSTSGATAPTPASWCAKAAMTSIVNSAPHAQAFAALCANGQPTALFTSLIAAPYTGSGTPVPKMIAPVADANGVVTAFFGAAQKLPISSAVQWTKVGPEQGVVADEENWMKTQGQTPKSCTITPEASNTDKFWSRGWTLADSSSQSVVVVTINSIFNYRADQYDFGDGSYMYTATFVPPAVSGGTIENYQLLTASLDIGGTGYLITVGNVAADDHGLASQAETAVTSTITSTIKFMYSSSAAAQ